MDDQKKMTFERPEMETVEFTNKDIITVSDNGEGGINAGVQEEWE